MFLLTLIRYLRGYVWFEARGGFVERFLNLAARARIPIWSGRKLGEVYTGCVPAGSYRKLRVHARKSGVKLRITDKKGAPFYRIKYRKRTGLLVGVLLFAGFVATMSQFIWRIEISGNQKVQDTAILQALDALDIAPGTLRSSIQVRSCESRLVLMLPDLSWAALNIDGSSLRVEVSESTLPPIMVDPTSPCNIIAKEAGQILSMHVFDGQAVVQQGDTVLPGDLIVSGILQDQRGQSRFRHASAKILARVEQELVVEVPLQQTEFIETGKVRKRGYLGVFGADLPLFLPFQIPTPYRVERSTSPLSVFSVELPVHWLWEEYILMEEVPLTLTEEEAKQEAIRELALLRQTRLGDVQILNQTIKGQLTDTAFIITAVYTCDMDIAVQKEIAVTE